MRTEDGDPGGGARRARGRKCDRHTVPMRAQRSGKAQVRLPHRRGDGEGQGGPPRVGRVDLHNRGDGEGQQRGRTRLLLLARGGSGGQELDETQAADTGSVAPPSKFFTPNVLMATRVAPPLPTAPLAPPRAARRRPASF